jgi:hypothetical protein
LLSLVIAVWGLVGALAAVLMARRIGQRALRSVLLVVAGATAVTLGLIIPDYRVLVFVAYAPVVVLGAPFGWPPGTNILQLVTWPLVNQLLCISGGSIWCAAAVAYARQTGGACAYCGRSLRALQPRACWPPKNCASNLSQAGVMFWLRWKRLVGS